MAQYLFYVRRCVATPKKLGKNKKIGAVFLIVSKTTPCASFLAFKL